MSGERPRPQFGEYATPEEQRAHIAQPEEWMLQDPTPAAPAEAPVSPVPPTGFGGAAAPQPPASRAPGAPVPPDGSEEVRPQQRVDRIVTYVLLGFGLFNVVLNLLAIGDLANQLDRTFELMGITGFTDYAAMESAYTTAAIFQLALWVVVAWLSFSRLRRGRITWWIPAVAGVVAYIVTTVLIAIPLATDPAVIESITSR